MQLLVECALYISCLDCLVRDVPRNESHLYNELISQTLLTAGSHYPICRGAFRPRQDPLDQIGQGAECHAAGVPGQVERHSSAKDEKRPLQRGRGRVAAAESEGVGRPQGSKGTLGGTGEGAKQAGGFAGAAVELVVCGRVGKIFQECECVYCEPVICFDLVVQYN